MTIHISIGQTGFPCSNLKFINHKFNAFFIFKLFLCRIRFTANNVISFPSIRLRLHRTRCGKLFHWVVLRQPNVPIQKCYAGRILLGPLLVRVSSSLSGVHLNSGHHFESVDTTTHIYYLGNQSKIDRNSMPVIFRKFITSSSSCPSMTQLTWIIFVTIKILRTPTKKNEAIVTKYNMFFPVFVSISHRAPPHKFLRYIRFGLLCYRRYSENTSACSWFPSIQWCR